jgi:hypothetical protein
MLRQLVRVVLECVSGCVVPAPTLTLPTHPQPAGTLAEHAHHCPQALSLLSTRGTYTADTPSDEVHALFGKMQRATSTHATMLRAYSTI